MGAEPGRDRRKQDIVYVKRNCLSKLKKKEIQWVPLPLLPPDAGFSVIRDIHNQPDMIITSFSALARSGACRRPGGNPKKQARSALYGKVSGARQEVTPTPLHPGSFREGSGREMRARGRDFIMNPLSRGCQASRSSRLPLPHHRHPRRKAKRNPPATPNVAPSR